jgi:NADPH-dependent curcumin reductase
MTSDWPEGQRVVLRNYPVGSLQPSDFAVEQYSAPALADGEFLVRTLFISVDPMLRLFVDEKPFGGAMPAMPLGTLMPGAAVGSVIDSRHPDFAVGELVEGRFGWRNYATSNGVGVNRVNSALGGPENALGIAGLPGFTAYVGLHTAGGIKAGQTILVSGAAGAVGSAAGALIRARGGRAVGIVGGPAKRKYLLEEVGYDAVADRFAPDFTAQLAAALPKGADIYFDNVGGPLLAQIIPLMARGGLVLICGLMAQYQKKDAQHAKDELPDVLRAVMFKGLRIQGFTQVGQDALRPAFEQELASLLATGQLRPKVHVTEGIEQLPTALVNLFDKSTTGKVVVRVASDGSLSKSRPVSSGEN